MLVNAACRAVYCRDMERRYGCGMDMPTCFLLCCLSGDPKGGERPAVDFRKVRCTLIENFYFKKFNTPNHYSLPNKLLSKKRTREVRNISSKVEADRPSNGRIFCVRFSFLFTFTAPSSELKVLKRIVPSSWGLLLFL